MSELIRLGPGGEVEARSPFILQHRISWRYQTRANTQSASFAGPLGSGLIEDHYADGVRAPTEKQKTIASIPTPIPGFVIAIFFDSLTVSGAS